MSDNSDNEDQVHFCVWDRLVTIPIVFSGMVKFENNEKLLQYELTDDMKFMADGNTIIVVKDNSCGQSKLVFERSIVFHLPQFQLESSRDTKCSNTIRYKQLHVKFNHSQFHNINLNPGHVVLATNGNMLLSKINIDEFMCIKEALNTVYNGEYVNKENKKYPRYPIPEHTTLNTNVYPYPVLVNKTEECDKKVYKYITFTVPSLSYKYKVKSWNIQICITDSYFGYTNTVINHSVYNKHFYIPVYDKEDIDRIQSYYNDNPQIKISPLLLFAIICSRPYDANHMVKVTYYAKNKHNCYVFNYSDNYKFKNVLSLYEVKDETNHTTSVYHRKRKSKVSHVYQQVTINNPYIAGFVKFNDNPDKSYFRYYTMKGNYILSANQHNLEITSSDSCASSNSKIVLEYGACIGTDSFILDKPDLPRMVSCRSEVKENNYKLQINEYLSIDSKPGLILMASHGLIVFKQLRITNTSNMSCLEEHLHRYIIKNRPTLNTYGDVVDCDEFREAEREISGSVGGEYGFTLTVDRIQNGVQTVQLTNPIVGNGKFIRWYYKSYGSDIEVLINDEITLKLNMVCTSRIQVGMIIDYKLVKYIYKELLLYPVVTGTVHIEKV